MKPTIGDLPAVDTNNELWRRTLEELCLQMTEDTYQTWLAHSYVVDSISLPAALTVATNNDYAREWLIHHLGDVVNRTVSAVAGRRVTVDFVVSPHPLESPIMPGRGSRLDDVLDRQSDAVFVPTTPPPPNIVIDNSLLKGDQDPMTSQHNPIRIRIYSHITQATFLHVEDALSIGKLRLFAGSYKRGKGIISNAHHFLDTADARVVLLALAQAEPGFAYQEFKGSVNDGTEVISRVFSVKAKGDRVYVELKNGPGRLTNSGAIQPNGKPAAEITILFKTHESRRLATEVLAYLQAWDVIRLAAHREVISGLPPYLLAPPSIDTFPAGSTDGSPGSQASDAKMAAIGKSVGAELPSTQVIPPNDGKANVADWLGQSNEELSGPDPTPTLSSPLLHYQDGTLVNPSNEGERKAFLKYRKDNEEDPTSLDSLRSWYEQHKLT